MIVRRKRELSLGPWLLLLMLSAVGCTQEPRVTFLANEDYFAALIPHLTHAKQEIVVSMFLFAPGEHESNRANQVMAALIGAAKRGVRVELFLDQAEDEEFSTEANRGVGSELRKHGIAVRFDSPGRTTHTKLVVIDRRYVFLGSHNFTHSALRHNNEASVLIESPKLAEEALAYIKHIEDASPPEPAARPDRRRPYAQQTR
jgi:phosphatidylserine/phosphatidylglycerophosphate/cardiolipin synthase-like enzyme